VKEKKEILRKGAQNHAYRSEKRTYRHGRGKGAPRLKETVERETKEHEHTGNAR